jgi:hypothetical protein
MKLVAVMSLDAYRDDLHRLFREREIEVFSEIDIEGYHHTQTAASGALLGWFGRAATPAYSTLTWAFLPDTQAATLLDAIADFNAARSLDNPVRAFQMPVDQAV